MFDRSGGARIRVVRSGNNRASRKTNGECSGQRQSLRETRIDHSIRLGIVCEIKFERVECVRPGGGKVERGPSGRNGRYGRGVYRNVNGESKVRAWIINKRREVYGCV